MQMAEQPTADSKSVIDRFHLLHAKISEVNKKGKKIKYIIKVCMHDYQEFFPLYMVSQLLISSLDLYTKLQH